MWLTPHDLTEQRNSKLLQFIHEYNIYVQNAEATKTGMTAQRR